MGLPPFLRQKKRRQVESRFKPAPAQEPAQDSDELVATTLPSHSTQSYKYARTALRVFSGSVLERKEIQLEEIYNG